MSGNGAKPEQDAGNTILLVDDEENILRALVRLLRRDGYNILTASSGEQGLDILKNNPVGVILSDQRMPEMSGVEFLGQVKTLYPDTLRLVLSGYTDLNSITDAINHGAIYKFLTKPWEDDLLRENVSKAFNHFRLVSENKRLNSELQKLNELLEKRVVEQNRESQIESHILKLTQDIMDQQPVGVLGISDDNMIVVANSMAHDLMTKPLGSLIYQDAKLALTGAVKTCFDNHVSDQRQSVCEHKDDKNRIISKRMKSVDGVSGFIITILPVDTR